MSRELTEDEKEVVGELGALLKDKHTDLPFKQAILDTVLENLGDGYRACRGCMTIEGPGETCHCMNDE